MLANMHKVYDIFVYKNSRTVILENFHETIDGFSFF